MTPSKAIACCENTINVIKPGQFMTSQGCCRWTCQRSLKNRGVTDEIVVTSKEILWLSS